MYSAFDRIRLPDIQNVKRGRRFRRVGNKMGVFSKFKEKLTKTKDNFSKKLFEIFNRKVINDDFFDELEFALISADIGVHSPSLVVMQIFRMLMAASIFPQICYQIAKLF